MHRHFSEIGSTNDEARAWARDANSPAPHGAFITADFQTKGRGRRSRDWISPAGTGVYLSMVWRPEIAMAQTSQLTIVAALAACKALEECSGVRVQTKWPNDVLLNGKKIGGVLCESESAGDRVLFVVVGIGLNINMQRDDLPERPIFPATSLLIETGETHNVATARDSLRQALETEYSAYAAGGWDGQRAEFISRCVVIGQAVQVQSAAGEYSAVAIGIDQGGLLIVQTTNGKQTVAAGDVCWNPL